MWSDIIVKKLKYQSANYKKDTAQNATHDDTTSKLGFGVSKFRELGGFRNLNLRERRNSVTHSRVSLEEVNNKVMKEIKKKREMFLYLKLKDENVFQHKTFWTKDLSEHRTFWI